LPECVIIQAEPHKESDIEAYKNVLNAVALGWRIETAAGLEKLGVSEKHLVLIVPIKAAQSLTSSQLISVLRLVESGAVLVTEGITPLSENLGFRPGNSIRVRHLKEVAFPDIEISWAKETQITALQPPDGATIVTRERKSGAPLVCLLPHGRGWCLLLAGELDPWNSDAYTRFPYFLQALRSAGIDFPFRSERLSAFFDYAYRLKENPDTLAADWRMTGIQALHIGAWYFIDDDQEAENFLHKLINACHRNGILVYAWLELPHVSEEFWNKHPKWRETTATGRDAHVDWRLVMNLFDPQCFKAVTSRLERLFRQFDWDGVNLAELYFDSPSGPDTPKNFTPLNSIVRSEYKKRFGIDPANFFKKESPSFWKKNSAAWKEFVEYRAGLERDLNERFIQVLSGFRKSFSPDLDIVVTYVDNIYDPSMREAVGADVTVMFDLLDRYDFTLVLEDPGTVWHLGPRRYAELAQTYSRLTRHAGRLGIDINIVDRDVRTYPTQKQTGIEFLELFYQAGCHFQTVMAYAEQSMLPQDAGLVSCALAADTRGEILNNGVRISGRFPIIYRSGLEKAAFEVNGDPWPCVDGGNVCLPAGTHVVSISDCSGASRPRLIKLNGNLVSARYGGDRTVEFSYDTPRRGLAIFSSAPSSFQVDGGESMKAQDAWVSLPRGSHKIRALF
jgi:hypothetical protein